MVLINSTSAFSALHYDIPVLVLGDAVYRHADMVTMGENDQDVATFFQARQKKSRHVIDAFLTALKSQSLLPGDFYAKSGRLVAVAHVIAKIKGLTWSTNEVQA